MQWFLKGSTVLLSRLRKTTQVRADDQAAKHTYIKEVCKNTKLHFWSHQPHSKGSTRCRRSGEGVPSFLGLHGTGLGACIASQVWLLSCLQMRVVPILQPQSSKGLRKLPILTLCLALLHAAVAIGSLRW